MTLAPPVDSQLPEVTSLTEHLALLPFEAPSSLLNTGPGALLAPAFSSLRC